MPYKNIEDRREAHKRWRLSHPDYWRRNLAYKANNEDEKLKNRVRMKSKRLYEERQPCEVCGKLGERHHASYDDTKVLWMCRKHHIETHQVMKLMGHYSEQVQIPIPALKGGV